MAIHCRAVKNSLRGTRFVCALMIVKFLLASLKLLISYGNPSRISTLALKLLFLPGNLLQRGLRLVNLSNFSRILQNIETHSIIDQWQRREWWGGTKFIIKPSKNVILLKWIERNSKNIFLAKAFLLAVYMYKTETVVFYIIGEKKILKVRIHEYDMRLMS